MAKYILKRLGMAILSLFAITAIIFILLRQMPIEGYLGAAVEKMSPEAIENSLRQMGLLDPIHVQLKNFYLDIFRGDLGESMVYRPNVPITEIIAPKIPLSLGFGFAALCLALLVGLPLGIMMSRAKGGIPDKLGTGFIVLLNAVPMVVFYLFIQIYGSRTTGIPMLFDRDNPLTWILPVICLSLANIANYAMWMRRYMVDQFNSDYVRLAKAKGLSSKKIMYRHVFRNAFVPMVQLLPSSFLLTIMGSIYIESLFSIPGMGGLLIDVIKRHDNTMVQALVLLYACAGIIGLLLGDLFMALADPRIKLDQKEGAR